MASTVGRKYSGQFPPHRKFLCHGRLPEFHIDCYGASGVSSGRPGHASLIWVGCHFIGFGRRPRPRILPAGNFRSQPPKLAARKFHRDRSTIRLVLDRKFSTDLTAFYREGSRMGGRLAGPGRDKTRSVDQALLSGRQMADRDCRFGSVLGSETIRIVATSGEPSSGPLA